VKELSELLIMRLGEEKSYLEQESEFAAVSKAEFGCLDGILRDNIA
jgi:hypothetical protein